MCRGTPNSQKGLENESPPTVIGEEEIDIKSDLWKDEDKTLIYKNGRQWYRKYKIRLSDKTLLF